MPTQDCVGRNDRRQVGQRLAADEFTFHGQATALFVVQAQAFLADEFQQDLNLGPLKLESRLQFPVQPPSHGDE